MDFISINLDVKNYHIAKDITQILTTEQAFHYKIVPLDMKDGTITFASDRSDISELEAELNVVLGKKIQFEIIATEEIRNLLAANYRQAQVGSRKLGFTPDFLEHILRSAKEVGSSDIHFEPFEDSCRIRFRLDGKLIEQYTITIEEYPILINKIKIRADLDISEKRLPQDGRITVTTDTDEFDIRVSTLPTLHGEKIVLRILSKDANNVQLTDLGFTVNELHIFKECIRKPNGMILISGPTGSGKTTTLYAALKFLNDSKTNILTIEDPIEYTLEGVNQVQLKESIGLDFTAALRTFLRQDPDIIMVGEIRDVKTANMAIRAALTGHLVLSTIHTNSAWATVSRLIDMGVPGFLIASTLNVSVAQRLIRKLCPQCKRKTKVNRDMFPDGFEIPVGLDTHFEATGCNDCSHTGYRGRKAIYGIIPITSELVKHIKTNESDIDAYLVNNKVITLKQNAIQMIKEGVTSIEEVYPLLTN